MMGKKLKQSKITPNRLYLVLITVLASILRIYRLAHQSLWLDEIFSLEGAVLGKSLSDSGLLSGFQGPLYYFLLHFWANLGESDFLIRLLSVFLGIGAVISIYFLGKAIFDEKVGILSAFILSISPMHIWYSQEVRMYILLILSSVVAITFFIRAFEKNDRFSWLGYLFATTTSLYSHPSAVFLIFGEWIFFIIMRKKYLSFLKRWLTYQMLVLLAIMPWLVGVLTRLLTTTAGVGLETIGRGAGGVASFPLAAVGYVPFTYSVGYSVGPSIAELHESLALRQLIPYWWILLPIFIIFSLTFMNGLLFIKKYPEKFLLLISLLLVPIISVIMLSVFKNMTFNVRYTLAAFPAFILILSLGIVGFKSKMTRFIICLLVVLVSAYSLNNYYFNERYAKEDSRSAARYITMDSQLNDVILITSIREPFNYYYKGDLTVVGLYANEMISDKKMRQAIEQKTRGYNRVWLVLSRTWEVGSSEMIQGYFDVNYGLIGKKIFPGIKVFLYKSG